MKFLSFYSFLAVLGLAFIPTQEISAQTTNYGANSGTGGTTNSYFGAYAGNSATQSYSVAIGFHSFHSAAAGSNNLGIGPYTGYYTTSGTDNVFLGTYSGKFNTTGSKNTFTGSLSGYFNSTGAKNTFTGYQSGYNNSTGNYNVFSGYQSGYNNNIGSNNTFTGTASGMANTNGSNNTFYGFNSGIANNTGINNVFMGSGAAFYNTSGSNNVFLGMNSGLANTTGSSNTFVGTGSNATLANLTNAMALGNGAIVSASNKVVVGNTAVTSIGGQVGWTTYSDKRLKKDIQASKLGLAFIMKLNPVTYEYKAEGQKDIRYHGLIAQEVDAAANGSFSGVDKNGEYWGIRYAELTIPLIQAVQEMKKDNDAQIAALQAENKALKADIEAIKALLQQGNTAASLNKNANAVNLQLENAARLEQNTPNPFSQSTNIAYYIPTSAHNAHLQITDINGKTVQSMEITARGEGEITLNNDTFAAGTYFYTLVIDNQITATQKMLIIKE